VLGFSASEVADTLDATPASVSSALQRAHKAWTSGSPSRASRRRCAALSDERLRAIAGGFLDAFERGDVDAVVTLLAEDAGWRCRRFPRGTSGRAAVAAFLRAGPLSEVRPWRLIPIRANGQLAFATYLWEGHREAFVAHGINVLTLRGDRILENTAVPPHPGGVCPLRHARGDEGVTRGTRSPGRVALRGARERAARPGAGLDLPRLQLGAAERSGAEIVDLASASLVLEHHRAAARRRVAVPPLSSATRTGPGRSPCASAGTRGATAAPDTGRDAEWPSATNRSRRVWSTLRAMPSLVWNSSKRAGAEKHVAEDQDRPAFADELQRASDRAVLIGVVGGEHTAIVGP